MMEPAPSESEFHGEVLGLACNEKGARQGREAAKIGAGSDSGFFVVMR
jgi:hypothetical protein